MKRITLAHLEELQASIPKPTATKYNCCLSAEERQIMDEIYKEAKLRKPHVTAKTMKRYRKEWE